eukprot:CAMPEP_0197056504 /NCGR_PEP_ID=MMETSP1384-20130603/85688_1 /TAXON_ID=29189 /ORGANISM="Ammonia sp." /LENGTH=201 /DNA_ID=CAMNT_0042490525 /DNA_START=30 /DNA_END=635 /DNA_ORIENTATION=+
MAQVKEEKKNESDANDQNDKVKLVIYDFDQTITCVHLYYELSQGDGEQLDELKKMDDKRLTDIFGGKDRVQALRKHFDALKANKIDLGIISYGYGDVIKQALVRMSLYDKYFEGAPIYGNDSDELEEVNGSKAQCIVKQFQQQAPHYKPNEIIFVDDDGYNINEAINKKKGQPVCQTVWIEKRKGMTHDEMEKIQQMAGCK